MTSHQIGQTYPSNCYAYILLLLLLFIFFIYFYFCFFLEIICPDSCCNLKTKLFFMDLAVREPTNCIDWRVCMYVCACVRVCVHAYVCARVGTFLISNF